MAVYTSLYPLSPYGFGGAPYTYPYYSGSYGKPQQTESLIDLLPASSESYEEVCLMQNLRFPTPPITPPRTSPAEAIGIDEQESQRQPSQQRTQSVIMKIGQGNSSPQHVPAEISILNNAQMINSRRLMAHDDEATCSESSTASNEYICDWIDCGRFFDSLETLAAHVNQIHAVASPLDGLYYCRWSGCPRTDRGFNARYKMLVHTRTHTKEKPHQCHLCDKSFSRAENLKIHIRSHSGERPYVCTFEGCSKKYSNSSDRFKHTRTHAMEKPYMCKVPGCQKRYTDPSSLRKHVKTFKHTAQMIDNTRIPSAKEQRPVLESPSYREVVSPPLTQNHQYYIGMEAMDNLDEYYYATAGDAIKPAANYWISSSIEQSAYEQLYKEHRSSESPQGMEVDGPLDLRMHRN